MSLISRMIGADVGSRVALGVRVGLGVLVAVAVEVVVPVAVAVFVGVGVLAPAASTRNDVLDDTPEVCPCATMVLLPGVVPVGMENSVALDGPAAPVDPTWIVVKTGPPCNESWTCSLAPNPFNVA
jgi:hypothetical protein